MERRADDLREEWLVSDARRDRVAAMCLELFGGVPLTWGTELNNELPQQARNRGWVAVPVERDSIWDDEAEALVDALTDSIYESPLLILNLEPWSPAPACYELPLNKNAIEHWAEKWWYGLFLVENEGFAILENDEYHVWIADPDFVETCLGDSVLNLRTRFRQYINEYHPVPSYLRIADFYGC